MQAYNSSEDKILVLDATAFYAGIPFLSTSAYYCTTPSVIEEVKHIKHRSDAINTLISKGMRVIEPDVKYYSKVKDHTIAYGEYELSHADVSVLALALMLIEQGIKVTIVSDDFSVANVAEAMGIEVSFTISKGIREVVRWVRYCKVCRIDYSKGRVCRTCGNELKMRKIVEKRKQK